MKRFTIQPEDDGMRLNRYVARVVPALPQNLMYKYLRSKRIKLNNKRCDAATRLAAGDELSLYLNDAFFDAPFSQPNFLNASRDLTVYYEDSHIAVLYKPAGVLSHAASVDDADTLVNRFLRYLYEKAEYRPASATAFTPALCHRLDRNTEGLVIAAKSAEALRGINDMIQKRRIRKTYLSVASGVPLADGVYTAYLKKDAQTNTVAVSDTPDNGAKEIVTAIRTLARNGQLCLLEIELTTGRPHQIRAHLAHLGLPIVGDAKYGDAALNKRYGANNQMLCAYRLQFSPDRVADSAFQSLAGRVFCVKDIGFVNKHFKNWKR